MATVLGAAEKSSPTPIVSNIIFIAGSVLVAGSEPLLF